IAPLPGEDGSYRFQHVLFRETIYEALPSTRRARMHRHVGAAIEELYRDDLDSHLPALVSHYRLAGPAADPSKAIDYAVRAAEAASGRLAYEEAVQQWQAALDLLVRRGSRPERRAEIHERLGDLLCQSDLDPGAGIEHLEDARRLLEGAGQTAMAAQLH